MFFPAADLISDHRKYRYARSPRMPVVAATKRSEESLLEEPWLCKN
ncbi:MAG: hypothetical protein NUV73_01270 [Candidatus Daviesbacteria bacterium]|nr:hypothetical protein [Candidatus Daviesbacteria bacterium]